MAALRRPGWGISRGHTYKGAFRRRWSWQMTKDCSSRGTLRLDLTRLRRTSTCASIAAMKSLTAFRRSRASAVEISSASRSLRRCRTAGMSSAMAGTIGVDGDKSSSSASAFGSSVSSVGKAGPPGAAIAVRVWPCPRRRRSSRRRLSAVRAYPWSL